MRADSSQMTSELHRNRFIIEESSPRIEYFFVGVGGMGGSSVLAQISDSLEVWEVKGRGTMTVPVIYKVHNPAQPLFKTRRCLHWQQ